MLKPSKTFKFAKSYKRMLALMKGSTAEQRNQFKRMMIDAQLCSEVVIKPEKKDRAPRGTSNYQVSETSAVNVE